MFTQLFSYEYGVIFLALVIAYFLTYAWATAKQELEKEKRAREEQKKIGEATAIELNDIVGFISTLWEWNDAVEKAVTTRLSQLLAKFEAYLAPDIKKEVAEDRAYRELLQDRYENVLALRELSDLLELENQLKRAESLFDTLTSLTPSYLEAIRRTKVKDDLRAFLTEGYKSLKNAASLEDSGKRIISSAIQEAKQNGLADPEISDIQDAVRRKSKS